MRLVLMISATVLVVVPAVVLAQWSDNFDGYPIGPLHGQGGWHGWNNNPDSTAYVTNLFSHSAPHSAEVRSTTDCLQSFEGVNADAWIACQSVRVYCEMQGRTRFVLRNSEDPGCFLLNPACRPLVLEMSVLSHEWAICDPDRPLDPCYRIDCNRWWELCIEADFDLDVLNVFMDGRQIFSKPWTENGGTLNLAAIELLGDPKSPALIFYDDMNLARRGATSVESSTWGHMKSIYH